MCSAHKENRMHSEANIYTDVVESGCHRKIAFLFLFFTSLQLCEPFSKYFHLKFFLEWQN